MGVGVEINHFGDGFHYDCQIHQKCVFLNIYEIVISTLAHMCYAVGTAPETFYL